MAHPLLLPVFEFFPLLYSFSVYLPFSIHCLLYVIIWSCHSVIGPLSLAFAFLSGFVVLQWSQFSFCPHWTTFCSWSCSSPASLLFQIFCIYDQWLVSITVSSSLFVRRHVFVVCKWSFETSCHCLLNSIRDHIYFACYLSPCPCCFVFLFISSSLSVRRHMFGFLYTLGTVSFLLTTCNHMLASLSSWPLLHHYPFCVIPLLLCNDYYIFQLSFSVSSSSSIPHHLILAVSFVEVYLSPYIRHLCLSQVLPSGLYFFDDHRRFVVMSMSAFRQSHFMPFPSFMILSRPLTEITIFASFCGLPVIRSYWQPAVS